jgi:2'-5' RNA ligase
VAATASIDEAFYAGAVEFLSEAPRGKAPYHARAFRAIAEEPELHHAVIHRLSRTRTKRLSKMHPKDRLHLRNEVARHVETGKAARRLVKRLDRLSEASAGRKAKGAAKEVWDEAKHPRKGKGRGGGEFAKKATRGASSKKAKRVLSAPSRGPLGDRPDPSVEEFRQQAGRLGAGRRAAEAPRRRGGEVPAPAPPARARRGGPAPFTGRAVKADQVPSLDAGDQVRFRVGDGESHGTVVAHGKRTSVIADSQGLRTVKHSDVTHAKKASSKRERVRRLTGHLRQTQAGSEQLPALERAEVKLRADLAASERRIQEMMELPPPRPTLGRERRRARALRNQLNGTEKSGTKEKTPGLVQQIAELRSKTPARAHTQALTKAVKALGGDLGPGGQAPPRRPLAGDLRGLRPGDTVRFSDDEDQRKLATVVRNYDVKDKHKLLVHAHGGGMKVIDHDNVSETHTTQTKPERIRHLRNAQQAANQRQADTAELDPRTQERRTAASHAGRVSDALKSLDVVPRLYAPPPAADEDTGEIPRRPSGPGLRPGQRAAYLDAPHPAGEPEPRSYHEAVIAHNDTTKRELHVYHPPPADAAPETLGTIERVPYDRLHPAHGRLVDEGLPKGLVTGGELPEPWSVGTEGPRQDPDPVDEAHPRRLRPGDEVGFLPDEHSGGRPWTIDRSGDVVSTGNNTSKRGIVLGHVRGKLRVFVPTDGQAYEVRHDHVHHVRHGDVDDRERMARARKQGGGAQVPPKYRGPLLAAIEKDRKSSHDRLVDAEGQTQWFRSGEWVMRKQAKRRGFKHQWPGWASDSPANREVWWTGGHQPYLQRTNAKGQLIEAAQLTEAKAGNTGAMVALYPPKQLAEKLAVRRGEKPEDLHVTLAFLGKAADLKDPEMVKAIGRSLAERHPPLSGAMSGHGVFTHGADAPVTIAHVDLPALPGFRQKLVRVLHATGHTPSSEHGFEPHMTLAYGKPQVKVPPTPVTFDKLSVVLGDERHDFPFAGHLTEAQGPHPRGEPTWPGYKTDPIGTRVRHVKSKRTGTLVHRTMHHGGKRVMHVTIQWHNDALGRPVAPGKGVKGRVVAPAFDLERLHEAGLVRHVST